MTTAVKILSINGSDWEIIKDNVITTLESIDFDSDGCKMCLIDRLWDIFEKKYYFAFAKNAAEMNDRYCVAWGDFQKKDVKISMFVWLNGRP